MMVKISGRVIGYTWHGNVLLKELVGAYYLEDIPIFVNPILNSHQMYIGRGSLVKGLYQYTSANSKLLG
jgi:hypothetical protein